MKARGNIWGHCDHNEEGKFVENYLFKFELLEEKATTRPDILHFFGWRNFVFVREKSGNFEKWLCKTKLIFPQPVRLTTKQARLKLQRCTRQREIYRLYNSDTCSCNHFRRVLIRQHKAQMKRKSKEIQEALVRSDCIVHVIIGPQCVHWAEWYWFWPMTSSPPLSLPPWTHPKLSILSSPVTFSWLKNEKQTCFVWSCFVVCIVLSFFSIRER